MKNNIESILKLIRIKIIRLFSFNFMKNINFLNKAYWEEFFTVFSGWFWFVLFFPVFPIIISIWINYGNSNNNLYEIVRETISHGELFFIIFTLVCGSINDLIKKNVKILWLIWFLAIKIAISLFVIVVAIQISTKSVVNKDQIFSTSISFLLISLVLIIFSMFIPSRKV